MDCDQEQEELLIACITFDNEILLKETAALFFFYSKPVRFSLQFLSDMSHLLSFGFRCFFTRSHVVRTV